MTERIALDVSPHRASAPMMNALPRGNALPGRLYGHYICATPEAAHSYSGSNVLYPAAHNHVSFYNFISAWETY